MQEAHETSQKEAYETPQLEIIEIDAEDIIFSSTCSPEDGE